VPVSGGDSEKMAIAVSVYTAMQYIHGGSMLTNTDTYTYIKLASYSYMRDDFHQMLNTHRVLLCGVLFHLSAVFFCFGAVYVCTVTDANLNHYPPPPMCCLYVCTAGAALGTVENLVTMMQFIMPRGGADGGTTSREQQVKMTGLEAGVTRAVFTVPFHIATGVIMGIIMSYTRFIKGQSERW